MMTISNCGHGREKLPKSPGLIIGTTKSAFDYDITTISRAELLSNQPKLTDVPANVWYADAVHWAVDKGMVDGLARYLKPNDNAPRGEVIEYMWKAAGSSAPTGSNPFTDVSKNDSYYQAVLWAYEQGITAGTGTAAFSPNDTCTRAQILTFLCRAYQ